jgi:hypothetical protein
MCKALFVPAVYASQEKISFMALENYVKLM